MNLHSFRVKNFRRLKDVHVELERDISIFVGANNSGKTSAAQAIRLFMKCSNDEFSIYDFSADCWATLNSLGEQFDVEAEGSQPALFPTIGLDLWFGVQATDLHRVIDILPSLEWEGAFVGLRIEFCPSNAADLITRFREARAKAAKAAENADKDADGNVKYHPWPKTLTEYLTERLTQEFELRYYVLDHSRFDSDFRESPGYLPPQLTPDKGRSGAQIIKGLLRVSCIGAQRHLSDEASGGRSEDLSRCLSRFYSRNLQQRENDYPALRALADSETKLNEHLSHEFESILNQLRSFGYPGLGNPRLLIKTALNPAAIMGSQDGASVHYAIDDNSEDEEGYSLPDRYNGLGFKNLILMVVELLDRHEQWMKTEEDRPPLHLIFVEEPEAHLHAQLQQVFIREILGLVALKGADAAHYSSQLVVTTHSPHILYERGFEPIRYFRRTSSAGLHASEVLNLSSFYKATANPTRDFLVRYMKLSHCDLFFADAAILVEGNVERLLMPLMISTAAERLKSTYLSILEIGGAFGNRFKSLIEFLGITALIVTDIDSVKPGGVQVDAPLDDDAEEQNEEAADGAGKACAANFAGAVTSNRTLIEWLPKKTIIDDLLAATEAERTQEPTPTSQARIRVAYQTRVTTTWNEETLQLAGRTLEEAFALENLAWCQHLDRKALGLRIPKNDQKTLADLSERLFKRVKASSFKKTDFALGLLASPSNDWVVPRYIADGLKWLADQVVLVEKQPGVTMPNEAAVAPVAAVQTGVTI